MTRQERPFVRVYHDDLQRDYPGVWDDDHMLANWLRLLVVADKMWPSPAELPRNLRPRYLADLDASKILYRLPKDRFALRGLDAERQRRADAARVGAAARWQSDSNANAQHLQSGALSNGNASRAGAGPSALRPPLSDSEIETTTGSALNGAQPEDAALSYLASVGATVIPDGNGYHRELVKFVGRQGADAVVAAMKARHSAGDRSPRQLIYGAMNDIERIHRPSSAKPKGHQGNREEIERAFNG